MIASSSFVSELLEKESLKPNRNLGQNFFINGALLSRLIENVPLDGKRVWEIGPGLGALTELLLERGASVTATEKDPNMVRLLRANLPSDRLTVYEGDCLKRTEYLPAAPFTVAGNLPYCITADILEKLFLLQPEQMVVMMQKEAGARFFAKPSEPNYMPLGAAYSLYYTVEKLGDISPDHYMPPPNVTSTMLYLKKRPEAPAEVPAAVLQFFSLCFRMRRKTLVNNLSAFDSVKAVLCELGLSPSIRAEALTPEELLALYRAVHKDHRN